MSTTSDDNNIISSEDHDDREACIQKWKRWVPMYAHADLFATYQQAQLCMLQKLDELLNHAEIPYWLCGGALIGAIRHNGFIPHDDDIDIECFQDDLARLAELPTDPPLFTGFVEKSGQWEGHSMASLQFFHGELEVDIFPRPSSLPADEKYFPSKEEVFPRTRFNLCNISVWGPNRDTCTAYLDRCYGKDWKTTVCVYNHDYNWYFLAGFDPRKEVVALEAYNKIVTQAGIQSPRAQETAKATFDQLFLEQDLDRFLANYKSYRFQRTIRWNRAAAEYREQQQQEDHD